MSWYCGPATPTSPNSKGHFHIIYEAGIERGKTDTASNQYEHVHVFERYRMKMYAMAANGHEHYHELEAPLRTIENTPTPISEARRLANRTRRKNVKADNL